MISIPQAETALAALEEANRKTSEAMILLRGFIAAAKAEAGIEHADTEARNPAWFLPNSPHLSASGIEFIYGLYDQGLSVYAVSQRMKISYRAAKLRKDSYDRLVASGQRQTE